VFDNTKPLPNILYYVETARVGIYCLAKCTKCNSSHPCSQVQHDVIFNSSHPCSQVQHDVIFNSSHPWSQVLQDVIFKNLAQLLNHLRNQWPLQVLVAVSGRVGTLRLYIAYLMVSLTAGEHYYLLHFMHHLRRGSAKQSVKDGLGSLWQHGNFNTSQLRHLSSYNDETLHVWFRPWDTHIFQVWLESAC